MVEIDTRTVADSFTDFYNDYYRDDVGELAMNYPSEQRSLFIDYDDLYQFDKDLAEDYLDNPVQMQQYAEEGLQLYDLPADVSLSEAHVRLTNLPETIDIRNFRVSDDHIGKMVQIKGIIRKATDVRPKITEAAFECQRCGTFSTLPVVDNEFQEPHECQGCEREGPFDINFDRSEFIDAQKLRVQESPEGLRGGETPQNIDVNIEDDIAGEVTPGDTVSVVGSLHIDQEDEDSQYFEIYIDGVSVTIEDEDFDEIDVADEDVERIEDLSDDPNIHQRISASISPTIYGFETEKLAMAMQLFGGVTKHLPDGSRVRGDLHMMLIGDPGVGKSQLISFVDNVAPRSVYTSGKGSSSAGLTAAAVRDDFGEGNQWSLEAGALVLADKGIAAVDELDKMRAEDQSAMHQALEQQEISVSKAGINATLKSRCSLLAAANPKHGRFDQYEPVGEQIELDPALVSRFDLIFTVTDNPDPEYDGKLADHILTTNYAGELNTQTENTNGTVRSESGETAEDVQETVEPDIAPDMLRKYVSHAKRVCFPVLTTEALGMLREFYVDMRGTGDDEVIPITARKLEALVRLSESSARIRLSNKVTEADAERAIEIVKTSLDDVGRDPETGEFDVDVIETGQSKTQRDRIKNIEQIIDEIIEEQDDAVGAEMDEIVDRAEEIGMDEKKVEEEVVKLKNKGEAYEPQTGKIKTT